MPIDPSIPLQAQQYSHFTAINQAVQPLASLAQLQNLQQSNQLMQAQTQNLQQNADYNAKLLDERNRFSAAMQDPNSPFKNPDGTIDYGKMQQWVATNTPIIGSEHASNIMALAKHVNDYKTTLSNMADSDMQRTNAVLHSFIGPNGQPIADPRTMINQLQALKRTLNGQGADYVDLASKSIAGAANPQQLQTVLGQLSRDTTPASTQTAQLQGSTGAVNTGAGTAFFNQNPEYGQPTGTLTGVGIQNQIGPSERQVLVNDPFGNPSVQTKDANGNIISGPAVQNPLGPKPLAPGDVAAIPQLVHERAQINAAAQQVPAQRFNNAQIIDLANKATAVGPGSAAVTKVLGALGMHSSGDMASDYQQLGHYVALQAQNNAAAMGVHTDAGQALASMATGNTEMNRKALIETTRTNDALSVGLKDFNQGMEAAIAANHGDPRAKRDFQNAWAQNFDPTIYKLQNAREAGDNATYQHLLNGLTPQQKQQLAQKRVNLLNLINNGHL
jgi:hypothetical protein